MKPIRFTLLSLLMLVTFTACSGGGEPATPASEAAATGVAAIAEGITPEAETATPLAPEEPTEAATLAANPLVTTTAEITAATLTPDLVGLYTGELADASSTGRVLTLTLAADGSVSLNNDYMNGEPPIIEQGTWAPALDSTLIVTLTSQDGNELKDPTMITFEQQEGQLTAIDYDKSIYGEAGLTLTKQATDPAGLTGVVWQLVAIAYSNDTEVVPDDPSKYTLEFLPDGKLAVQADCNRGTGSYTVENAALTFSPLAYTRARCPEGSLFDEYTKDLNNIASYVLSDGKLNLAMAMDGGILQFAPAEP